MALQYSFPGPSGLADSTAIRKDLAGLILRDTSGNVRPGVFPRTSTALASVVAGTWTLSLAAFEGCLVRGGGPLFIENDGALTTPANTSQAPVSNSRIDILYLKQNESASPYSDANNLPTLGWVYGTPSASPVKNSAGLAAIAGAQELLTVQIPSTATSLSSAGVTVTETVQFTALFGTSLVVRTAAELSGLTAFVNGRQRATAIDTGVTYLLTAAGWKSWESDWITYTPTLTNMTIGNGSFVAEAKYINGRITVRFAFTLGSTSAISGSPSFSLPGNARAIPYAFYALTGSGVCYDASAGGTTGLINMYRFNAIQTGAVPVTILTIPASGVPANISSSAPMVWATGDVLSGEFTYDPA